MNTYYLKRNLLVSIMLDSCKSVTTYPYPFRPSLPCSEQSQVQLPSCWQDPPAVAVTSRLG